MEDNEDEDEIEDNEEEKKLKEEIEIVVFRCISAGKN